MGVVYQKKFYLGRFYHPNPVHRSTQITSHPVAQFPSISYHLFLLRLAQLPCTPFPKIPQFLQNTDCVTWAHICISNYSNSNYNRLNFQITRIKETRQQAYQNLVVGRTISCEGGAACRRKTEPFSK
jgi:hypothetical protein